MTTTKFQTKTLDLSLAYQGSFYTICGAGGDLNEWFDGYEGLMAKYGIGKPKEWYVVTGEEVNEYAHPTRWQDAFPPDLTILMFPLDGLDVVRLAVFRLMTEDRWFDDIVDNMRRSDDDEDDES